MARIGPVQNMHPTESSPMNLRALAFATGLAVTLASTSKANIVGSTYDFFASAIGATEIGALDGTYTDPAESGFLRRSARRL